MQVVDNFKSRLRGMPIDGSDGTEANELFGIFQKAAQINDFGGVSNESSFAEGLDGFENRRMRHLETSFFVTDQSSAPFFHM